MSEVAKLFDNNVQNKNGDIIDLESHCAGKIVGIYFSAHWCPPCRGFTPVLAHFYNLNHRVKNFEIIFVSSDRDQSSFDEYYENMPWLALKYNERELKNEISAKYGIQGIPTLVLINADTGHVYSKDARSKIQSNEDIEDFPWQSKKSKAKCSVL